MKRLTWLVLLAGAALQAAGCQFGDDPQGNGRCGDAVLDVGEGCDDGNLVNGDGCSASCSVETARPACGNGVRESSEGCDDGNTRNGDGCSAACTVETPTAVCGNGMRESSEACDDGNVRDGDGCSATCQVQAVCALVPNSGCATGSACDADDHGVHYCRAKGAGVAESSCTSRNDCNAGLTCVDKGNGISTCVRYCEGNADCNGAGAACLDTIKDIDGNAIDATLCTFSCNPVSATGCPTGLACHVFDNGASDASTCELIGSRLDGQSCTDANECGNGSQCVDSICRRACDLSAPNCLNGRSCVGTNPALVVGSLRVGVCF